MGVDGVRVEGLDGLELALSRVVDRVAEGAAAAVEEGARAVAADVRLRVGVDTGRERAAVEVRTSRSGAQVGVFDPGIAYEQFPEFGTSKQPARPAFAPAAEAERVVLPDRVEQHVARRLR
jgi:HK97 gp10 family phage protein